MKFSQGDPMVKTWTTDAAGETWAKRLHPGAEHPQHRGNAHPVAWFNDWALDMLKNFQKDANIWQNFRKDHNGVIVGADLRPEVANWPAFRIDGLSNFSLPGQRLSEKDFHEHYEGSHWEYYKQMHNTSEGAVLEIMGDWKDFDGPPPLEPGFWHAQFAVLPNQRDLMKRLCCPGFPGVPARTRNLSLADVQQIGSTTVVQLDVDVERVHRRRWANVISVAFLIALDPKSYTAQELCCWAYYTHKLAKKKCHPVGSKDQQVRHKKRAAWSSSSTSWGASTWGQSSWSW
jgi:hypothetical protein